MNSLIQSLSEKQPFEVREITTFLQKKSIFLIQMLIFLRNGWEYQEMVLTEL